MTQYLKITIQPGQMKRSDISDWQLSTGEYIWIAEDGVTFDPNAPVASVWPGEPVPPLTYTYDTCTQADIDEIALLAFGIRKTARIELIQAALIDAVKGIVALFQVGRDKGIWLATDFDSDLRDRFADWIALINEHESDPQDPPEE